MTWGTCQPRISNCVTCVTCDKLKGWQVAFHHLSTSFSTCFYCILLSVSLGWVNAEWEDREVAWHSCNFSSLAVRFTRSASPFRAKHRTLHSLCELEPDSTSYDEVPVPKRTTTHRGEQMNQRKHTESKSITLLSMFSRLAIYSIMEVHWDPQSVPCWNVPFSTGRARNLSFWLHGFSWQKATGICFSNMSICLPKESKIGITTANIELEAKSQRLLTSKPLTLFGSIWIHWPWMKWLNINLPAGWNTSHQQVAGDAPTSSIVLVHQNIVQENASSSWNHLCQHLL